MPYPSYVSTSMSGSFQNAMQSLHATFARPIIIYQAGQQTVIYSNPNHNFLYPDTSNNTGVNTQVSTTVVSGVYMARIHYEKKQTVGLLANSEISVERMEQLNIKNKMGEVKIILDATGYAVVENCQRISFDNSIYQVRSDPRPHGVVGVYFYNLYLTPLS